MNIATGMSAMVSEGDSVAIKRIDQEAEETIYVGEVTGKEKSGILETSIPGSSKNARYEVLGVSGENRKVAEEAKDWFKRFETSQYNLYLKAAKRECGDIQIEGI